MAGPKEIPDLVGELVTVSKDYLTQEVVEPARTLGRRGGLGLAAGALYGIGALLLGLAVYPALLAVLPDGEWWVVLARLLTGLVTGGGAAFLGWWGVRKW